MMRREQWHWENTDLRRGCAGVYAGRRSCADCGGEGGGLEAEVVGMSTLAASAEQTSSQR